MVIRIYESYNAGNYEAIIAKDYDEMRSVLRNKFKEVDNKYFNYFWLKDGLCASVFGVGECEEDTEKMLDMVTERLEKFGECIFLYDVRSMVVEIYLDESVEDARQKNKQIEKEMDLVDMFILDADEHGTIVEAVYTAIKSALNGEAKSVEEALNIAKDEWYK